jgi:crotonobetainyl-CoA:carnitine CoA-transferase CaiB-like acyl-CoA transferase
MRTKLKTGRGQIVDTSLLEAALQQTYWHAAIHFATGESPGRADRRISSPRPIRRFAPATDGSTSAVRIRRTGSGSPTCWDIPQWRDDPASRPIRRAWRTSRR